MHKNSLVLIIVNDLSQGGAETQALYLAAGLKRRGYTVKVLSFGIPGGLAWDKFKAHNIDVAFTGFREKLLIPPFTGIKKIYLYFKYKFKLVQFVRRLNPDFIIPFTYAPNFITADIKKWVKAKTLWNQRDEGRMFKGISQEIKALQNADFLISNSKEGKTFLSTYTDREIQVIFNGVQTTKLNKSYIESSNSGVFRLVMVANLHHFKDHLTLLKAWKRIRENYPQKRMELIFAGRFSTSYEHILQFVKDHHLTDHVQFLGAVVDIHSLLSSANIGVLSSTHEGLPNAILEYMERGLPVVATRINGSEDALGKDYPFLTPPGDDKAMADAIVQLMLDPEKAAKLGKNIRERVIAEFSIDKMVDAYESLLRA